MRGAVAGSGRCSSSRSRGDRNPSSPEENGSPAASAPSALQPPSPPDAGPRPWTFAPDSPAPAVRGRGHPETGGERRWWLRRRGWMQLQQMPLRLCGGGGTGGERRWWLRQRGRMQPQQMPRPRQRRCRHRWLRNRRRRRRRGGDDTPVSAAAFRAVAARFSAARVFAAANGACCGVGVGVGHAHATRAVARVVDTPVSAAARAVARIVAARVNAARVVAAGVVARVVIARVVSAAAGK